MITASHNPPEYNGIKLFNKNGTSFTPEQEEKLENIIGNGDFEDTAWDVVGSVSEDKNAVKKYSDYILSSVNINKKFNVVVDCANAAACGISYNFV